MRTRVAEAIEEIKENGLVEKLKICKTVEEKEKKLLELLPIIEGWVQIARNQLIYYIQGLFKIDMGVCPFYVATDHYQCCTHGGSEMECNCNVPMTSCVIRDKGSETEEPEADLEQDAVS